jgi:transposase-like protein
MSKIHLSPSRITGLNGSNGRHLNGHSTPVEIPVKKADDRRVISASTKKKALKEFANSSSSGPQIAKKYGFDSSLLYLWSKNPKLVKMAGLNENSFGHRRLSKRKKSRKTVAQRISKKTRHPSGKDQADPVSNLGPVCYCPQCGCNIRNIAIVINHVQ